MKISQMNNDQACEAMIRMATPLSNLLDDEDVTKVLETFQNSGDVPIAKMFASVLPQLCMISLQKHRNDLYEVVGALTIRNAAEVGKENFLKTIKEIKESIDEDFLDFFDSLRKPKKGAGKE